MRITSFLCILGASAALLMGEAHASNYADSYASCSGVKQGAMLFNTGEGFNRVYLNIGGEIKGFYQDKQGNFRLTRTPLKAGWQQVLKDRYGDRVPQVQNISALKMYVRSGDKVYALVPEGDHFAKRELSAAEAAQQLGAFTCPAVHPGAGLMVERTQQQREVADERDGYADQKKKSVRLADLGYGSSGSSGSSSGSSGTGGGISGPVPMPPAPPPAVCRGTGRVVTVGNAGEFQSALNAAGGGDTIVLRPGSYGTLNITKGGSSATSPIYIAAENPAVSVSAQPQSTPHSSITNLKINAGNVTVCGMFFDDGAYKSVDHEKPANNVTYLQNYFNTGVHESMNVEVAIDTWEGGTNLVVQSNYFNATRSANYAQDYGLALFAYNGAYVRGNVFDGVFNHAVSLKWGDNNVLIDGNVFRGCGQVCVEIGQQQDFEGSLNNTGSNATISNNTLIEAYASHPQSGGRKAMLLRNEQNITVRGNTFQGTWTASIATDFMNRGGLARLADRPLGIYNLRQDNILIEGNRFGGGKLNFMGRGTGRADRITLQGNTGGFSCTVAPLLEAEGKQYVWPTIDRNPPTVTGCP